MALKGLGSYGTRDIVAIDGGVYLWLTNSVYTFTADGKKFTATVVDGVATAERVYESPWITSLDLSTEGEQRKVSVVFETEPGVAYRLLRSEDIARPVAEWTEVDAGTASGIWLELVDANPPAERASYAVQVVE